MLQVCVTCLQEINDLNFISLGDATSLTGSLKVRDVLSICVPELTLDLLADPIMCAGCMNSLHVAYDFRCKCLNTEQRIRSYVDNLTQHVAVTSQENNTAVTIYALNVDPKIKTEWFEGSELQVWIKNEPQSSDEEQINYPPLVPKPQEISCIYTQSNELTNNKIIKLDLQDTDSGCSSSNADSDMNSSGDPAEGNQLRKALEAPRKRFECDVCKKTFDRSTLFHLHKKIHDDKPFKCALCKYSATLRLNLVRHMREHTETKPHTYNLCDCSEHPEPNKK